jgi:hypothetical protein
MNLANEAHPPMLYLALISALEGTSLELLATEARPADVARAKKVMRLILDRVLAPASLSIDARCISADLAP